MAAFVKFEKFVEQLAEKAYDLGSDQLMIALTSVAPVAATSGKLADLTEIAYTNITENREVTTSSSAQTSGTYKLVCADLLLHATGDVANFRYIVLYDDDAANKELVGYWDYGVGGVTLHNGETFNIDFDGSAGVLTIA
jgi:hypothetical protein